MVEKQFRGLAGGPPRPMATGLGGGVQ
jgi:hypothetical protein